jgi:hypothetical protein
MNRAPLLSSFRSGLASCGMDDLADATLKPDRSCPADDVLGIAFPIVL